MSQTFSIKTLGCKLNQYESDEIAQAFINAGWSVRSFGEKVDLVIVNTCTVTDKSDKHSRNLIRQGARYSNADRVIVTGCLVNRDRDAIEKMPEVMKAYKTTDSGQLTALANQPPAIQTTETPSCRFFRARRYIKIQDGCDGSCSYCVVPSVRGKPASRSRERILDQAKRLIEEGCPEIVLTGITIGKYCEGDVELAALAQDIANLSGNFRLRITSIEPMHVTEKLIDLYAHEKLCSHIHLPIQSGSDKILRAMRRPYGIDDYQRVLNKIRSQHPNIAVGTDIIVGFPGESEEDFQLSLRILENSRFAYVHQFSFSPRAGTPAAKLDGRIQPQLMAERVDRMREVALKVGREYRDHFIGSKLRCVVSPDRKGKHYRAVSDNYIRLNLVDSPHNKRAVGTFADVEILATSTRETMGRVVSP